MNLPCVVVGCTATAKNAKALTQHMWAHHGPGQVPASCPHCDVLLSLYQLSHHKRVCAQQARIVCECGGSYKNVRSFQKHLLSNAHLSALKARAAQPVIQVLNMERVMQQAIALAQQQPHLPPVAAVLPLRPPAVVTTEKDTEETVVDEHHSALFDFGGGFDGADADFGCAPLFVTVPEVLGANIDDDAVRDHDATRRFDGAPAHADVRDESVPVPALLHAGDRAKATPLHDAVGSLDPGGSGDAAVAASAARPVRRKKVAISVGGFNNEVEADKANATAASTSASTRKRRLADARADGIGVNMLVGGEESPVRPPPSATFRMTSGPGGHVLPPMARLPVPAFTSTFLLGRVAQQPAPIVTTRSTEELWPLRQVLQSEALAGMLRSMTFHANHWRGAGTNTRDVVDDTRTKRATLGVALLCRYVEWTLTADNSTQHQRVEPLVPIDPLARFTLNSFEPGTAIAQALLESSTLVPRGNGCPSIFLNLESGSDASMLDLLGRTAQTKSGVHTALAMCAAIMAWLLTCALRVSAAAGREQSSIFLRAHGPSHEAVQSFLTLFQQSAKAPAKHVTSFKNRTVLRGKDRNLELWHCDAEVYCNLLYATFGDLMHFLEVDVRDAAAQKQTIPSVGNVSQQNRAREIDIASTSWTALGVLMSGVGNFSMRTGLMRDDNEHAFVVATSEVLFNDVKRPHSGVFLSDGRVYLRVAKESGQKGWSVNEKRELPPFASELVRVIINNELLGSDSNVWKKPVGLKMNKLLAAFQARHGVVVPHMLDQKSVGGQAESHVAVTQFRAKRVRVQFEAIVARNAAALRAVNDAIANEEVGQNDGETIEDDDEHEDDDDDDDGSDASDGSSSESEEVAKKGATVDSIVLTQRVVRRLLTTLAHDLFMRRWISAADLFSTTFTNLHGLKEARQSYSCIEQIFRDYDDADQSRWKEALKTARESLNQQDFKRIAKLNDTATGGFAVVNARSIARVRREFPDF